MLMWLLPEVCYISLLGKVCNSFIGSTGTGSRTGNILFTERYSLKSVCVWSGAGEHSRLHSSRSIRAGHRGEGGTGTGGTFNIERACCFWYLLYVVYFYTHWKNKVRWDLTSWNAMVVYLRLDCPNNIVYEESVEEVAKRNTPLIMLAEYFQKM